VELESVVGPRWEGEGRNTKARKTKKKRTEKKNAGKAPPGRNYRGKNGKASKKGGGSGPWCKSHKALGHGGGGVVVWQGAGVLGRPTAKFRKKESAANNCKRDTKKLPQSERVCDRKRKSSMNSCEKKNPHKGVWRRTARGKGGLAASTRGTQKNQENGRVGKGGWSPEAGREGGKKKKGGQREPVAAGNPPREERPEKKKGGGKTQRAWRTAERGIFSKGQTELRWKYGH